MNADELVARLRAAIRDIPDFPQPGVVFKDITPVLGDAVLFADIIHHFADLLGTEHIDVIAGIESRGFIFGAPLAIALHLPFVPIRKIGKLPATKVKVEYALEYGTDALEVHADAIAAGARVLIVDDLLATGGTAAAAARLVREVGGEVAGFCIPVELTFLNGRERISAFPLQTLVRY